MAGKIRAATIRQFYEGPYHDEHRVRANMMLHAAGTVASAALLPAAMVTGNLWLVLLYPVLQVGPGLVGHRLFERDTAVGDVRIGRSDYPLWWFVVANHRLTWDLISGRNVRAVE